MFFRLVLEGRVQHSAFSSDFLPALTWRLSLGPGPSLYSDQLTFHLYSIHLMRLQKPSLQRLSTSGHSDMGRPACPGQMEIRRLPGKGRIPGLCLGDGFKAEP